MESPKMMEERPTTWSIASQHYYIHYDLGQGIITLRLVKVLFAYLHWKVLTDMIDSH